MNVQVRPLAVDHPADEEVARLIRAHHADMVAQLDRLTAALRDAGPAGQEPARADVATWFETVLVPHADEEEQTTYAVARELDAGRLLIDAMEREHVFIKRLVALFQESTPVAAAAYARAVFEAFRSHQAKENELILPLLLDAPRVSLAAVAAAGHGHQSGMDGGPGGPDGHSHVTH